MITITFLTENKTDHPGCLAEHGLSIYIETSEKRLLFDTGASGVFLKNAMRLDIDISSVDAVIISHGHYDHTGGVPDLCKENDQAKIYIHEKAFQRTYGMKKGTLEQQTSGIRWSLSQFDQIRKQLVLTRGVKRLTEDILISGSIPDEEGFTPTERFFIKGDHDELTVDKMEHEQFLAIRDRDEAGQSRGVYLFCGCSHKGVISSLRYAKQLFPGERIMALIAGMHLYNSPEETRHKVIQSVMEEEVHTVIPVHCTGIQAICDLKAALGERCIVATAGDVLKF